MLSTAWRRSLTYHVPHPLPPSSYGKVEEIETIFITAESFWRERALQSHPWIRIWQRDERPGANIHTIRHVEWICRPKKMQLTCVPTMKTPRNTVWRCHGGCTDLHGTHIPTLVWLQTSKFYTFFSCREQADISLCTHTHPKCLGVRRRVLMVFVIWAWESLQKVNGFLDFTSWGTTTHPNHGTEPMSAGGLMREGRITYEPIRTRVQ